MIFYACNSNFSWVQLQCALIGHEELVHDLDAPKETDGRLMFKDEELDHGFESDGNQDEKSEKSKSSKFKPNHDKSQQSKSSNNNEPLNASDITPESSDESQSEGEEKSEIDKYTSTTGQPPFHRKNAPSDAPLMSKPCKPFKFSNLCHI